MPEPTIPDVFNMPPVEVRAWVRQAAAAGPTLIDETTGAVIVLRYADVEQLLTDTRMVGVGLSFFDILGINHGPLRDWYGSIMFTNEGKPHHRMRSLVGKAFSPRSVEALRPVAAEVIRERLARIRSQGEGDLVAALADAPTQVMCRLLGVPQADVAVFTGWVGALSPVFLLMSPVQIAAATESIQKLLAYTADLCARREAVPGDDLISALIAAEHDGERLTRAETAAMVANLLVAGHDTTASQSACTFLTLLAQPDLLAEVRANPDLIPAIVTESIRLEPSIGVVVRTLTAPVEICGIVRPAGAMIVLNTLSANTDPAVWRDPHAFDPRRFTDPDAPRMLTFGGGVHACLGTWLARLTLEEMVRAVADLSPTLNRPKADIPWTRVLGEYPERLPVAVG